MFYVKTTVNRPCNSQLILTPKFGKPRTIYLSYGHCDDLPYFDLNPVVNYVFAGSIDGRAYNADYGQYGSGGVNWVTNFRTLSNVDAETGTNFGGLKDSIGVPGLNMTAYCWTDNPLINSVNPLPGFLQKRAYQGSDEFFSELSAWTVVVTFDRQAPRYRGSGYNPLRPYGLQSLSNYRTYTAKVRHVIGTNPIFLTTTDATTKIELLSFGYMSAGKFVRTGSIQIHTSDGADRSFTVQVVNTDTGRIENFVFNADPYPHSTFGHMKLLFQRFCNSMDDCQSRVILTDETGTVYGNKELGVRFKKDYERSSFIIRQGFSIGAGSVVTWSYTRVVGETRFENDGYYGYTIARTESGCMDYGAQYILQGVAVYDRNLTDAEVDLVLRRRPLNGTASVTSPVLLGQYLPYNTSKAVPVFWYPREVPWLYNRSDIPYSVMIDGRDEITSFASSGTFGYTLTVDGQVIRYTDTVFGQGLRVNLIIREQAPTFKSLSLDLPAFLNVSLLNNINVYQATANTNRIKQINIFAMPANVSLFLVNGTVANPVYIPVNRTGNYSIDRDFIARWEFTAALPMRVEILDAAYMSMGAVDQAVFSSNVLESTDITLVLKSPIVPPSSKSHTIVEDTFAFFDIPPAIVYSKSGVADVCDSVIVTGMPRNGSMRLVPNGQNATAAVPILTDFSSFNCGTHRLLYTPDPDFDWFDFFFVVYNCSVTQSVPQNHSIAATPVQDNPRTTTPLTGSIVVSDPLVYVYARFDVFEVDTRDAWWLVDISCSSNNYLPTFFNASIRTRLAALSGVDNEMSVNFLRGDPEFANIRIAFEIKGNRTLLTEVLRSIRIVCGTVVRDVLRIKIQDKFQKDAGTALEFTRDVDCQVQTVGAAGDPDSPPGYGNNSPGGGNSVAANNIIVLAINLVVWPVVGIAIVCGMYFVKNMFRRYKSVADSSLEAASALSKGDFKAAASAGMKAARAY
jgi:hypothetical protein